MSFYPNDVVCLKCMVQMRVARNSVSVITRLELGGKKNVEGSVQQCDRYECPECGAQILKGFARDAFFHWEGNFAAHLKHAKGLTLHDDLFFFDEKKGVVC